MVKAVSKALVCGMKGVGKTALIEQLIYGNITKESVSEIPIYLKSKFNYSDSSRISSQRSKTLTLPASILVGHLVTS